MASVYIKMPCPVRGEYPADKKRTMDFTHNNHHNINDNDASNFYYADPLNYGGGYGYSISAFMANRYVRSYWIAFFALWVYWGLLWFLRHAFGNGHKADYVATTARQEPAAVAVEEEVAATGGTELQQQQPQQRGWVGRARRPHSARTHVSGMRTKTLDFVYDSLYLYRVDSVVQVMSFETWY